MHLHRAVALLGLAALLGPASLEAGGLPTCRVRLTTVGRGPSVSRPILEEVASAVNDRERGTVLVRSVAGADVLLELGRYTFTLQQDGTPDQRWSFAARRLGEPDPAKATHLFTLAAFGPVEKAPRILERLPPILMDVCLGVLPGTPYEELYRRY